MGRNLQAQRMASGAIHLVLEGNTHTKMERLSGHIEQGGGHNRRFRSHQDYLQPRLASLLLGEKIVERKAYPPIRVHIESEKERTRFPRGETKTRFSISFPKPLVAVQTKHAPIESPQRKNNDNIYKTVT